MNYNEIKKVVKMYDETAKNIEQIKKVYTEQIYENILTKIRLTKKDIVLDVGCGNGILGNQIKEKCSLYVGMDISFKSLKQYLKISEFTEDQNLLQSISNFIPFKNKLFDISILNGVTEHFSSIELLKNSLAEIERITSKNGKIFLGNNVVPSGIYWEFTWFQNKHPFLQIWYKLYIDFRLWLSKKNVRFAGKWKNIYEPISLKFLKKFFDGRGEVIMTKSATYEINSRKLGKNYKGNRRMDFIIKLNY